MSIRQGLLALLAEQPRYGYQLRAEFEARTGATWPLNVGQVYSTHSRLERDGLVTATDGGDEGQIVYAITDEGRVAVEAWFASPVERTSPPRDELAIKLALAVTVPGVDVARVVQQQRTATLRALRDYTKVKARAAQDDSPGELAWLLVVDALIFQAEAEVRWLDACEERLARAGTRRAATSTAHARVDVEPEAAR